MNGELVTIIVPVYNVQTYLEACLNSILEQSYQTIEVILIDDGSTDGSGEICDRYSKNDARFKTIHKPNGGVSSARNEGLKVASGWSVAFVDSDDTIDSNYIESMVDEMIAYDVNFVRARFKRNGKIQHNFIFNDNNETVLINLDSCESLELLAYAGGIMLRTCCIGKNLFDENLIYGEDQLFLSKCFFASDSTKILLLSGTFYNYTYRENSASNKGFNEKWLSLKKSADAIVESLAPYPCATKLAMRTKKNFYLMLYKKLCASNEKEKYKKEIKSLREQIIFLRNKGVKSSNINIEIVELSRLYGFYGVVKFVRTVKRILWKRS